MAGAAGGQARNPDRLVFDLDPDVGLDFNKVKSAALRLRALLADLGLVTFPLLTGGKGITSSPARYQGGWPAVKSFAERFSRAIAEAEPEVFTANIRKNQRKGRISSTGCATARCDRGDALFGPGREGAPVAAPIAWEELDGIKGGNAFSIRDADELTIVQGPSCSPLGPGAAEVAQGRLGLMADGA